MNEQILRNAPVNTKVMGREEATSYGALAFFGDKYGERVRVVEVPGFSKEFCGGTHVRKTGDIGLFLVTSEQGMRRARAAWKPSPARRDRARAQDQGILDELEQSAKTDRTSLVDEYAKMWEQLPPSQKREIELLEDEARDRRPPGQETDKNTRDLRRRMGRCLDPAIRRAGPQGAPGRGGRLPEPEPGSGIQSGSFQVQLLKKGFTLLPRFRIPLRGRWRPLTS